MGMPSAGYSNHVEDTGPNISGVNTTVGGINSPAIVKNPGISMGVVIALAVVAIIFILVKRK